MDVAGSEFDQTPFPIVAVAEAMGATARLASDPAELRAALAALLIMPGVRVVDARIARATLSEAYQRQHATRRDDRSR